MAIVIDRHEIAQVIRAAFSFRADVVNLSRYPHPAKPCAFGAPADPGITPQHDLAQLAPPRSVATLRAGLVVSPGRRVRLVFVAVAVGVARQRVASPVTTWLVGTLGHD